MRSGRCGGCRIELYGADLVALQGQAEKAKAIIAKVRGVADLGIVKSGEVANHAGQGFAAVTWSGMVWALGYERTRSLLPGMLAHAGSNLLATSSFLLLLRF